MATWRCPNCGTHQSDAAARCFICNRSATSCGTCAQFRSSLVGGVGFCALDRRREREPLSGAEQRECWTSLGGVPDGGLFDAQLPIATDTPQLAPAPEIAARVTPR